MRLSVGVEAAKLLARTLYEEGAILFGEFKLSSGGVSRVYVDARRLLASPRASRLASSLLTVKALEALWEAGYQQVVGVATAGVPWAVRVADALGLPCAYARSERKGHGTARMVEAVLPGAKALIVDDVATTGSSVVRAAEALREVGVETAAVLLLVDRGGGELIARRLGVPVYAVATLRELIEALRALELITPEQYEAAMQEIEGSHGG